MTNNSHPDITFLEELSINAWPALRTVVYDGWMLRFSNGYSRRANSCHALYDGTIDTEEKILFCQEMYNGSGLESAFKLTPASRPENLEPLLEHRGYLRGAETSVQTLDLQGGVVDDRADSVELSARMSDEWLTAFCMMRGLDDSKKSIASVMLSDIVPERRFASVRDLKGRIVACGLAVRQGKYCGLFDIVTDIGSRGKGIGSRLTGDLLRWGREEGAEKAYLQAMVDNVPALRLYSSIGFHEAYRYWYRTKPLPERAA